jgi:hypothetical protein
MAIIPVMQETSQQSVNHPDSIGNSETARAYGNSISDVGNEISRAGAQVGQYLQKQQEFKSNVAVSDGQNALHNIYQQSREYANQNSQADGSDIQTLAQQYAQTRTPDVINQYGIDARSKVLLNSYMGRLGNDASTTLMSDRVQKAERFQFDSLDRIGSQNSDSIRANPTEAMVAAKIQDFGALVDHSTQIDPGTGMSILNTDNAAKVKNATLAKYGRAMIEGSMNNGVAGMKAALPYVTANEGNPDIKANIDPTKAAQMGLIDQKTADSLMASGKQYEYTALAAGKGKPLSETMTAVMNSLQPEEKERYRDQIMRGIQAQAEISASDFHGQLTAMQQYGADGKSFISDQMLQAMNAKVPGLAKTPTEAKAMYNQITSIKASSDAMHDAALEPEENFQDILHKMDKTIVSAQIQRGGLAPDGSPNAMADPTIMETAKKARAQAELGMKKMVAAREDDPVDFLLTQDNQARRLQQTALTDGTGTAKRAYYDYLANKQDQLGISNPRVLAKADAEDKALTIEAQHDANSIDGEMKKLRNEVGADHFGKAVQELAETNPKVAEYATGVNFNREARMQYYSAVKNEKSINDAFSAKLADRSIKVRDSDLNEAMAKTGFPQIKKALSDANGNDLSNLNSSNNLAKAMQLVVKGRLATDPTKPGRRSKAGLR